MFSVPPLVAMAVFCACVGLWPAQARRLSEGWTATRLRHQFRSQVRRARLRSVG